MENILLVEPAYENKYPPIGLMKISSYHKMRGDYVEFYKGKAPYSAISKADRVYITTLFTFYFDITMDTIYHYMKYMSHDKIYVGGIAATLIEGVFREKLSDVQVLTGQLVNSSLLGYDDEINIDVLPLDYDILDDIEYSYGVENNFFSYATRGCPRKCKFCGVKILEPKFEYTNNIIEQVSYTRISYGDKRNIMLMDNNVLYCNHLQEICDDLVSLGFKNNSPTYVSESQAILFYNKIDRRIKTGNPTWMIEDRFISFLRKFIVRIRNTDVICKMTSIIAELEGANSPLPILLKYKELIIEIVEKYRSKQKLQRYVDFNQGIDARLLTEEKMAILSVLPLRPMRLAYDNIDETDTYLKAFNIAYKYGVRHFSNYMLYNFEDTPEDLWQRAYTNIQLFSKHTDISAYSFPMKYAPIDRTDRSYVGVYWNKKYLSAMNIILNVTRGVIAKEFDFFVRAYGATAHEFIEVLSMPDEFIKHRNFFEESGLILGWQHRYKALSPEGKVLLVKYLSGTGDLHNEIMSILPYYKITKYQVESKKAALDEYVLLPTSEQESKVRV